MEEIAERIEAARRKLLDLGLRNPLLNWREQKARGARIVDEIPREVYRILVQEGRSMTFLPARDGTPADDEDALAGEFASVARQQALADEDGIAARHKDTRLQTPYGPERLQYRLLNSYYAARTAIEEQGINVLYLALGMLVWYEDQRVSKPRMAPLVLVPVSLERRNVRTRFRLSWTGEEIEANLSLQAKLKADFGLELPEFDA
ncbi:MAG: DUF4011 domain-containing protein, partial [Deltaproteobacteria bacterium]